MSDNSTHSDIGTLVQQVTADEIMTARSACEKTGGSSISRMVAHDNQIGATFRTRNNAHLRQARLEEDRCTYHNSVAVNDIAEAED